MDAIVDSIYNEPEKWSAPSEYWFSHENGIQIWICNGRSYISLSNCCNVSFVDKWRIWKAYKWWIKQAPLNNLAH